MVLAIGAMVTLLDLTSEGEITSNPESERGYELIGRHFPRDPKAEYVSELDPRPLGAPDRGPACVSPAVEGLRAAVEASETTPQRESYYESGDASLVSQNRHATLITVGLSGDCEEGAGRLLEIAEKARTGDFESASPVSARRIATSTRSSPTI